MIKNILSFNGTDRHTFIIMDSEGRGKSQSISMIRFIAMLMIIACHICQYFDNFLAWWLNVGVQIFFIISGFLYGSKQITNPVQWFLKNTKKILLPYYLFLIPVIVLYFIFAPANIDFGSTIRSLLCIGTIDGIGNLWFVGYILFCYLITPILYEMTLYLESKSTRHSLLFISIFMLLFYALGTLTNFYFKPYRILCYIIGFFIPLFIRKRGNVILKYLLCLTIPATIISKFIYLYLIDAQPEMNGISHIEGMSHLFFGISLTFGLMFLLKRINHLEILNFSDKYSYSIYIVHQLLILSPFTLMAITHNVVANIIIVLMFISMFGIILQKTATAIDNQVSKYIKF